MFVTARMICDRIVNEEERSLLGVMNPADFGKPLLILSKYARLV